MSTEDLPLITLSTYLNRLVLRTHLACDDQAVSVILSRPDVMKHLSGLAPPGGWTTKGVWLPSDMAARAEIQAQPRREKRSISFNGFIKETGELVGMTGLPRIDPVGTPGRKADWGTIFNMDEKFARKGYATEAMHAIVKYAFEELDGVEEITMHTNRLNREMRGWAEGTAGLEVCMEIQDVIFGDLVGYSFTRAEWEMSCGIRRRLEKKLDNWKVV